METSGQDGGVGRHMSSPRATIKRITTNLKTNSTQNCQKFELYGNSVTKDLKKPHLSRQVGKVETRRQGGDARSRSVTQRGGDGGGTPVSHSCAVDKNQEGYHGSEQSWPQARPHVQGFQCQEDKAPTSGYKNQWRLGQWKKLPISQESLFKGPTQT